MKQFLPIFFFCLLFSSLYGQQDLDFLKAQNLQKHKAFELQSKGLQPSNEISSNSRSIGIIDADGDGMDDDWESANGLDPNDREDAYDDDDNDDVLNIYEFTMQSDPNDESSPSKTDYTGTAEDLSQFLEDTESGLLIRIPGGTYPIAIQSFNDSDYSIMIQGGWSNDFSEYNPESYPTIFDNNATDEAIYYSNGSDDSNLNLVIDGLTIQNSFAGTFSAITLVLQNQTFNRIAIGNCTIVGNNSHGITLNHWTESDNVVHIHNTVIADNNRGIASQITGGGLGLWTIDNVTIANNRDEGVHAFTLGTESLQKANYTNFIAMQNRGENQLEMRRNMEIQLFNSSVGDFDISGALIFEEVNSVSIEPVFTDTLANDYSLAPGSAQIDAGVKVGLKYNDAAPDIGAIESGMPSNTNDIELLDLSVFPNPTSNHIEISSESITGKILLYDSLGKLISLFDFQQTLDVNHLNTGMYTIILQSDEGIKGISRFQKI